MQACLPSVYIRSNNREKLKKILHDKGVSSVVYYPIPVHLQEAVSVLGYEKGDFPVAEEASEKVLSLPIYPELEESSIREIAEIINHA